MATADQVDVVLSVRDAQYLARLKADEAAFSSAMRHIQADASGAGNALNNIGTRGAASVNALAGSTKNLSSQTGNLAAQFNDIGVQLAGGQSPFLIALQQGSQINQVLGQTGARGAVAALGGAFASLLNPVSLATIAIITLAGTAVQYFGTVLSEGKSSTEEIKKQNDVIREVAERWGEAVPALRAYVDELDRAANQANLEQAVGIGVARSFEELRGRVGDIRAELAAARIDIQAVGGSAQEIDALQVAFDDLARKIQDGTADAADLESVLAVLAGTTGSQTVPTLVGLTEILSSVSAGLAEAARNADSFRAALVAANAERIRGNAIEGFNTREFVAEQERLNGLTAEELQLENEIARVKSEAGRDEANITDQQALEIAQARLAAEERRSQIVKTTNAGAKAGASAATEAERERQAVVDLISALEFERSVVGLSAGEKAVQTALRRAGAAATDEERAAIEELITATYAEQEAVRSAEQAMATFENIASNAFSTFLNDIRQGKDAAESLSNVFDNIAGQLINIAVQGLVKQAFGGLFGGGGGLFGGLFGGRGFASGTENTGGQRGEPRGIVHGQEAVIPLPSGGKVPVQIQGGGGSGGSVDVRVFTDSDMIRAEIVNTSGRVSAEAIASYDGVLTQRVAEKQLRYG